MALLTVRAINFNQAHKSAGPLLYQYCPPCARSYNLDYYSVTKEDTCLLSITINFDPHVMQVCVPLRCAAPCFF